MTYNVRIVGKVLSKLAGMQYTPELRTALERIQTDANPPYNYYAEAELWKVLQAITEAHRTTER